jgi:hypothetical protein
MSYIRNTIDKAKKTTNEENCLDFRNLKLSMTRCIAIPARSGFESVENGDAPAC